MHLIRRNLNQICVVITVSLVSGILVILAMSHSSILASVSDNSALDVSHLSQTEDNIEGRYRGTLVVTSPANIGVVDLSIQLDSSGNNFTGTIFEAGTTHFSGEPTVNASITSSTDGIKPTFTIQAQPFTEVIANQTVTRTFAIEGEVLDDGNILNGIYSETITGYTRNPLRIEGAVLLARTAVGVEQVPSTPAPNPPAPSNEDEFDIYLPLINIEVNSVFSSQSLERKAPELSLPEANEHKVYLPFTGN